MLSVQEVSTAHRFTTLSGREVFVMQGKADFELDSLIAACHDASCRPPTSGGTGGSSRKGVTASSFARICMESSSAWENAWLQRDGSFLPVRNHSEEGGYDAGVLEKRVRISVRPNNEVNVDASFTLSDAQIEATRALFAQTKATTLYVQGPRRFWEDKMFDIHFREVEATLQKFNEAMSSDDFSAETAEEFACRSAACRPPTSGGTGGSLPGGISGLTYGRGRFPLTRDVLDNAANAFISIAEPESLSGYKAHIFADNLDDMEYILRRIKPHLATEENPDGLGAKVATQSFFNLTEGGHPQHGKAVTIYFPHRDTWKADLEGLVRDMEDLPSRMHKTITGDDYAGNGVSWRFELKADPGRDLNPHEYHDWYKAAFSLEEFAASHGIVCEEFACRHASCRPPTSGGTGGSRPSSASGPSAAPKTKKVTHGPKVTSNDGTWADPLYKPSAFGKKVRDMIDADPILSKRKTGAELIAHLDNLKAENAAVAELELEYRLRTGKLSPADVVLKAFEVGVRFSYEESRKDGIYEAAQALRTDVQDRIRKGEHAQYVDDPNAPVRDKIDEMIRDAIVKRLASPESPYATSQSLIKIGDLEVSLTIRPPTVRVKTVNPTEVDYESITPEYEAASTRVGKVIHDEIQSRAAKRVSEFVAKFDTAMDELRAKGYDPDDLETFVGSSGIPNVEWKMIARADKGLDRMTPKQKVEVAAIMVIHGLTGTERRYLERNAEIRAQQAAYREVMSEIVPMGGVMSGTPGHRKPTSWKKSEASWSSNEQVVAATSKYPSSWTELSNHRGPVTFKQTEGRAHYQDRAVAPNGRFVSVVTLDGSVSTAVHEIGHRYESTVPGLNRLEELFHSRRTKNEHAVSLAKLFPGHRYGKDEQTYEDDFFDSYAGKTYSDGRFHELVTVGMEGLTMGKQGNTPKGPGKIDDDYSAFLLGALVTLVKP